MAKERSTESKVDLNQASAEVLESTGQIDGMRARYLVEHRNKVGGFRSWEDVKGAPSFEEGMVERLQHAGFAISGTGEARAAEPHTGSAQQQRGEQTRTDEPPPEDLEAEMEEEDASDDPELDAVYAMIQLDHEAALSYETAAELVSQAEVREQLLAFASDHHRHVRDLSQIIQARTDELPELPSDDISSVFVGFASALGELGSSEALRALVATEEYTNATYSTALDLMTDPEVREILDRNFSDEQRHLAWLLKHRQGVRPRAEASGSAPHPK